MGCFPLPSTRTRADSLSQLLEELRSTPHPRRHMPTYTHMYCTPSRSCAIQELISSSPLPHMSTLTDGWRVMNDVQATHRALAEHAKRDPYGAFHVPPHCPQFGTAAAASAANGCCSSTAFRAGEMGSVFLFCFFLPHAEILDGVGGADMVHEGLPASVDSLRRTSLEIRSVVL